MEYLLSEEEFGNLKADEVEKDAFDLISGSVAIAREKILSLAEFTCIHDEKNKYDHYCDDCPCSYLSDLDNRDEWQIICGKHRNYSK